MNEIAIISGKGGTGKTSLSAAFATITGNIIVADCDVDAANLHLILLPKNYIEEKFISGHKAVIDYNACTNCGLCANYCRFGAIEYIKEKVTIYTTSCDGCKLCARICPSQSISMVASDKSYWYVGNYRNGKMVHARLAPGEENSGKLVNVVRDQARKIAKDKGVETIIIDGPPGIGCPAISSITGANKVIIVTEPSCSGFHDLKRILELTANFNIKSYIVINKFDLNLDITCQINDWCIGKNIPVIGKIPFDAQIVEAMIHCQSIIEWAPNSDVTKEIYSIYNKVINEN